MIEAFPAYDDTQHEWGVGLSVATSSGTPRALSGSASQWFLSLNPLPIQPGQYDFSTFTARSVNVYSSFVTDARIAIYSLNSGAGLFRLEAFSLPLTLPGSGAQTWTDSFVAGELSLAAKSAVAYFWALAVQGKAGRAGNPAIPHQNSGQGPVQSYVYNSTANMPTDPNLPSTLVAASADFSPSSGGYHVTGNLTFTTTTRKVFSLASAFTGNLANPLRTIIPYRTDGAFWIVLREAVVADTKTLTCELAFSGAGANKVELDTLLVDMTDYKVKYNKIMGTTKDVDFSSSAEAGEKIDYAVVVRDDGGTTRTNPFWVNRSTGQGPGGSANDIMTRSHRTWWEKNDNSQTDVESRVRGKDGYAAVTNGNPEYLDISSSDVSSATSILTVEVCDTLNVLFGDSDIGRTSGGELVPGRLGAFFPDSLEHPLTWWLAGIPNDKFLLDTPTTGERITGGYQRFCNDAAGEGDICDMRNLLIAFHMGGNDLKDDITEDNRNNSVSALLATLNLMISQVFQNENELDNRMFLFSMPIIIAVDAGGTGTFDSIQRKVFDQWSQSLLGLACTWRLPFYNPYYISITNDDYMDDASGEPQHYANTGAAPVCAAAAIAYQANRIGGAGLGVY